MNSYIERNIARLPLLRYCSGAFTQEAGVIRHLLSHLKDYDPYAVEFGQRQLGGGTLGEIARIHKFSLLNLDSEASEDRARTNLWEDERTWTLLKRRVSPFNLNALFDEANVPQAPAVAVVDVDGMDYWCLLALLQKRRPAVLIAEYNCNIAPDVSASLAFNAEHTYQKDKNYGASMRAIVNLAASHQYQMVHIHGPLNLYFIDRKKILDPGYFEFAEKLADLSAEALSEVSDPELFYDSFHAGTRPSWFHAPDPDPRNTPWVELDRIGDTTHKLKIEEISLEVFSADKGGDHYRQRGHKEDSVSPLWSLIKEKLRPSTLIDIGANYGYTTSLLAKRLGVRRAIAVEPDPRLARILQKNLESNLPGIDFQVVAACVSSHPDQLSAIGLNPSSTQDNRILAQKNWQQAVVCSMTLADLIAGVDRNHPLFIKCDTQGYDMDVLASGWEELSSRHNWMMRFEFAPFWVENQGFNPAGHLERLCLSFQVFEAPLRTPWKNSFKDIFLHPLDAGDAVPYVEYVRSLNHNRMGWVDLYILPKEPSFLS